jgi:2-phosphoglycerate kinase
MIYPKVILMGGAPLIGKTAVAQKLAIRLEYSCLATDDLVEAIIAVTTPQSHPHLHLLEHKDHRKYFIRNSVARLVADAEYRNEGLWPAIKAVITKHAESAAPIVMDGWHILPDKVAQMDLPGIASIWLVAGGDFFAQKISQQADQFRQIPMGDELMRKFIERSTLVNDNIRQAVMSRHLPLVEVSPSASVDDICNLCLKILPQE